MVHEFRIINIHMSLHNESGILIPSTRFEAAKQTSLQLKSAY